MRIYTDGSCKNNKKGSFGFITVKDSKIDMCFAKVAASTTNNKMELMALYSALRYIKKCGKSKIEIYSDSKYVVEGYDKWIEKWVRNGWKTYKGNDVLNKDIWEKLFKIKEALCVLGLTPEVKWVKAHSSNKYNNYIDNLVRNLTN